MKIRHLLESYQFRGYTYDASAEELSSPEFHCINLNLLNKGDNRKNFCEVYNHGICFTGGNYDVTQLFKPTLKETWVPITRIDQNATLVVHSKIVSFNGFPLVINGTLNILNREISTIEGLKNIDFIDTLIIGLCSELTDLKYLPYYNSMSVNLNTLKNNLFNIFMKGNSKSFININAIGSKTSFTVCVRIADIINGHFKMLDGESNKRIFLKLQNKLIDEELEQYCETS